MARERGVRTKLAGVFEATEKTAPASGYILLPNRGNTLGVKRDLIEDDILGDRDPGDHELDVPTADGTVQIPLDLEAIGFWLKALLGAPDTTEDLGVYTHVFESGGWTLPTMALERQMPSVPSYEMFLGAKANRLQYTMQRSGRVDASVDLIAQGAVTPASSSAAGTPSSYDLRRFVQAQGAVSINGSDPGNVVSCDFSYANNLDPVETMTDDGFIGGLDELRPTLGGTLRMRFASESIFSTAKANTSVALQLVHTISASAKLTMSMPRVFLSVPDRPVEGAQGVEASFQWRASREVDGPMLTATLINEVESY
ncbi:phage tail tube protein [Citreimonas sp.]|uniref:phage tail tube protein n=1 Tax=Citreimonas sp. TaxID=3036715 RepID=UPI004058EA19